MNATAVTTRTLETLRNRGVEVIDLRGTLPPHPKGLRYGQVRGGLSGVRFIIQHWTGDSFTRQTLRTITGTDYGTDIITDRMTPEDEQDLILWYHQLHQKNDGGTWPGIAYGMLVFPSGRLYCCWDLGTLTYHAYNANAVSYAISCPNANAAEPTYPQMVTLNHVWDVLCNHTPEIPATHQELYGHREVTFLDNRNSTSCPGTFLPHVQRFRQTNKPTVELPNHNPHIRYFPETGHYVGHGFRGYWEREGGLEKFGYPLSEEYDTPEGITVQWFERARFEYQPDIAKNPWGVVLGLVGREAAEAERERNPEPFRRR